jgi:hypothetical protein
MISVSTAPTSSASHATQPFANQEIAVPRERLVDETPVASQRAFCIRSRLRR